MRGPKLAILLAIAALGVGFQNYVFFAGAPDAVRAIEETDEEEDFFEDEARLVSTVTELDAREVTAWLSSQEGRERSPFLTAAEARESDGPLASTVSGLSLRLSGTLFSAGRRVAWINGRPRSEGEWIGESQLVQIDSRSVVLLRDGSRVPLSIERGPISVTPGLQVIHAN